MTWKNLSHSLDRMAAQGVMARQTSGSLSSCWPWMQLGGHMLKLRYGGCTLRVPDLLSPTSTQGWSYQDPTGNHQGGTAPCLLWQPARRFRKRQETLLPSNSWRHRHSSSSLASCLQALCFWAKVQSKGLLFWKAKTLCGEKEETIQEGKTNPISWPFPGTGVAWPLKVVKSPPKPGSCLGSRSPAHYLHTPSASPHSV